MSQSIPRGIEVLIKKASVDESFKTLLLCDRAAAVAEIGLELGIVEQAMLQAVPREQLAAIIARTSVPEQHRRAFLGHAAAAMLAVLGMSASTEAGGPLGGTFGNTPDRVTPPQRPAELPPAKDLVVAAIATQMKLDKKDVHPDDKLIEDLKFKPEDLQQIRKDLEGQYGLTLSDEALKKFKTVKQVTVYLDSRMKVKKKEDAAKGIVPPSKPPQSPFKGASGGIRPH